RMPRLHFGLCAIRPGSWDTARILNGRFRPKLRQKAFLFTDADFVAELIADLALYLVVKRHATGPGVFDHPNYVKSRGHFHDGRFAIAEAEERSFNLGRLNLSALLTIAVAVREAKAARIVQLR